MRQSWSDAKIIEAIAPVASELGRMPSAPELKERRMSGLGCAISRTGGFVAWAARLGLGLKASETLRGRAIESYAERYLSSLGFAAERQSTKSPCDLIVDGCVRVDVKSARHNAPTDSFVFGINKPVASCDIYMLCGVDGRNEVLWRYFVPWRRVTVTTLHLRQSDGHYAEFLERHDLLGALVRRERAS